MSLSHVIDFFHHEPLCSLCGRENEIIFLAFKFYFFLIILNVLSYILVGHHGYLHEAPTCLVNYWDYPCFEVCNLTSYTLPTHIYARSFR